MAYLLGEKEFWSLPLAVRPGVLVPRPETELVVERALEHFPPDAVFEALDLAAGSGAIALAIASERPRCRMTATDLSPAAIAATLANAVRLGLGERVVALQGSWFEPAAGRSFDLIVSNPPYIATNDPRVEAGVRRYEPPEALFAGPTGLEALQCDRRGRSAAPVAGGWLIVEHGDAQGAAVRGLFEAAGFADVRTHRDLGGPRAVHRGSAIQYRWPALASACCGLAGAQSCGAVVHHVDSLHGGEEPRFAADRVEARHQHGPRQGRSLVAARAPRST